MSDLLMVGASLGSALLAGITAGVWGRRAARGPLLARVVALEEDALRERTMTRRKLDAEAGRHAAVEQQLRRALGLGRDPVDGVPVVGRALAARVLDRILGLATVDEAVIADGQGLAWTSEASPFGAALASTAACALGARFRTERPREIHVELADARHVVIRPLMGTLPALALAVASTSRPASAFALDAATAHASVLLGLGDEATASSDPLTGYATRLSRGDAPITVTLARELEAEVATTRVGLFAVVLGGDVAAAFGEDGPPEADLDHLARELKVRLLSIAKRLGGVGRRIDWTTSHGSSASLVLLGERGRSALLAVVRDGLVDVGAFDRLAGRLRRLLPADAPAERGQEARS